MNKIWLLLLIVSSGLWAHEPITVPFDQHGERHIVIVVASYNNATYYQQNLSSIFDQLYKNYHVIYIDDCSTDGTYDLVKQYVERHRVQDKVVLIHNEKRQGALFNQYQAIHRCKDTDLVVILDGDDWFFDRQVLIYLNKIYSNHAIWLTYGQFVQHPTKDRGWCSPMPEKVIKENGFRDYVHAPGHLRTFYAGLFKQIKQEDLMYNGEFFQMSGDVAAMFPMIEMAHLGHFYFITKVLMVYNIGNPINDHKVVDGLQRRLDVEIRGRRKYDAIATPFLSTNGGIENAVMACAKEIR